jgi:hypothetical protein
MAGTMTHTDYVSDQGVAFRLRIPQWVATLCGAGAVTSLVSKPAGKKPRRRYYLLASGREGSFVVPNITSTMWTDAVGTAVTVENLVFGGAGVAATLQGWTGEKTKAI